VAGIAAARAGFVENGMLGWGLAAAALVWALSRRTVAGVATIAIAGALTYACHAPGPPPELDAEDNEVLLVGGCVVEPPSPGAVVARFTVELEPGARIRVTIVPRDGEIVPELSYGQIVDVEARVRKPRNFGNPGSFDFAAYLARQHIYWTAVARGAAKLRIVPGECGSRWSGFWFAARQSALRRIRSLFAHDSYTAAIMAGMLIGDASAIERTWTEDFRRTGTYHTLVISGLHITVVAGVLLLLLRLSWISLGTRLPAAAAVAWSYALLTGMQAPVTRAAAGFTLFVIARFFYRRGRVLNLVAAVAFVYLAADPEQLFEASFQLSFLAVAAIGAFAVPLLDRTSVPVRLAMRRIGDSAHDPAIPPRSAAMRAELRLIAETVALWSHLRTAWVASFLAASVRSGTVMFELIVVSACVQIGLVLPLLAYFHRLSWTTLSANTLVVPLLSAAVPAGFLAIVTGWTWPATVASGLLAASRAIASWHAQWEPSWRIPDLPPWLAVAFGAAVAATAFTHSRVARTVCAAAATVLLAAICIYPLPPVIEPGKLEVSTIDVGQGESVFVATPEGKIMMIDGGGIPVFDERARPRLEIGEDVVSPYLWSRRIRQVHVLALTHAHDDHARGLIALIENFRPSELWTGAQPTSGVWVEIERKAREYGVRVLRRNAGERSSFGGVNVEVLAPARDHAAGSTGRNNDSLVLRIAHGRHRFLLTGDIERQVEGTLVASGAVTRTDVLKVPHHGSKTSSTDAFLEAARPAFALISAGRFNTYGHPHPDVIDRLAALHTRVLRTDESGLITLRSDGRRLEVSTDAAADRLRHPFSLE
jgi:competence protein ComEC